MHAIWLGASAENYSMISWIRQCCRCHAPTATYHFTDSLAGFLVGFGALPTPSVRAACRALAQALAQVEEHHLSE